jgi:hypothetical protein
MLPEHKISLPKAEYNMRDPIQKARVCTTP